MIGANYWSVAASGVRSLYCDLCATPWWWSSVLLKLCGEMLQVYDMNNSTIMGNGIMHLNIFLGLMDNQVQVDRCPQDQEDI